MNGKYVHAHRAAYILFVGPVPDRVHVHHIQRCKNKRCIRPDHLMLLSAADHARLEKNGADIGRMNALKTHCPQGHPYSGENLIVGGSGSRFCRACRNQHAREQQAKKKGTGPGRGSQWSSKTHCPRGHEYSGDNLYVNTKGSRVCRACKRLRYHESRKDTE